MHEVENSGDYVPATPPRQADPPRSLQIPVMKFDVHQPMPMLDSGPLIRNASAHDSPDPLCKTPRKIDPVNADLIQRQIVLKAGIETVWRAISESDRFGAWFGVRFDGPFVAGTEMTGRITPTLVDPEVARMQEPHTGKLFQIRVQTVQPPHRFAFGWHPFAIDPAYDYSREPMTLVTFDLEELVEATRLTITESGFDRIPIERRAQAWKANDGGWSHQAKLIEKYLDLNNRIQRPEL